MVSLREGWHRRRIDKRQAARSDGAESRRRATAPRAGPAARARPDGRAARRRGRHVGAQHPQPPHARAAAAAGGARARRLLQRRARRAAAADPRPAGRRLQPRRDRAAAERLRRAGRAAARPAQGRHDSVRARAARADHRRGTERALRRARAPRTPSGCASCKLLVPLGDDRFEVPSPALLRAAEQVVALGIPLHAALVLVERVSRDCDSISRDFTKLFLRELWEPFDEAGQPDEGWDELIEAVDSLRPLASEALLALFKLRMTSAARAGLRQGHRAPGQAQVARPGRRCVRKRRRPLRRAALAAARERSYPRLSERRRRQAPARTADT